jgi:hypothetical protein
MPAKVSERKLFLSLLFFAGAVILILNVNVFSAPVRISEKGLGLIVTAIALLGISVRMFRKAIVNS